MKKYIRRKIISQYLIDLVTNDAEYLHYIVRIMAEKYL